jgi:hypothetical protein
MALLEKRRRNRRHQVLHAWWTKKLKRFPVSRLVLLLVVCMMTSMCYNCRETNRIFALDHAQQHAFSIGQEFQQKPTIAANIAAPRREQEAHKAISILKELHQQTIDASSRKAATPTGKLKILEWRDKTMRRTFFLCGIETGSSPLEAARRRVIRQSYLGIYQNSATPHRICPLSDLSKPGISSVCEVAYAFFQDEKSAVSSTTENDIVYLETQQMSGFNISTTLAWFRYASTLGIPFDYIAKVDSDTILFPDLLLNEATNENGKSPTSEYAATGTDAAPGASKWFTCKVIMGDECSNFNGRFYYLSRDLASLVGNINMTSRLPDVDFSKAPEEEIILQLSRIAQSKRVEQKYLGRLLTRKDPTEFLNYWHTHRNATHAFQKLQRDYNTSITYVTGKFGRNAPFKHAIRNANNWVVASGLEPHQVHALSSFPDFILNDQRWERHLEFLTNETAPTRGGGYWFWKGPLIQHYFDKLRDGDILIFSDSDVMDGWGWTHKLLKTMLSKNNTFALYETDFLEHSWTKQDILRKYCGDAVSRSAGARQKQYSANFLVFIKSPGTTRLLQDWIDALADFHLVSDEPSAIPNFRTFRENRHDQSILSTMLKCQYSKTGRELFDGAFTLRRWKVPMFRI